MELGNQLFGHSRGLHPVDRNTFTPLFHALLDLMGQDTRGETFDNTVFAIRPYCWCEKRTCMQCSYGTEKNFVYKLSGLEMSWYKYALRDAYTNVPLTLPVFRDIITTCMESLETIRDGESREKWINAVSTMYNDRLVEFMKSRVKHNPTQVIASMEAAREKFERNATAGAHVKAAPNYLVDVDGKPLSAPPGPKPKSSSVSKARPPRAPSSKITAMVRGLTEKPPEPITFRDLLANKVNEQSITKARRIITNIRKKK